MQPVVYEQQLPSFVNCTTTTRQEYTTMSRKKPSDCQSITSFFQPKRSRLSNCILYIPQMQVTRNTERRASTVKLNLRIRGGAWFRGICGRGRKNRARLLNPPLVQYSLITTLKYTCYDESQTLAIVRAVVCLPTCNEFVEWMADAVLCIY